MLYRIEFADQVRVEGKTVDAVCDHRERTLTVCRTSRFTLDAIASEAFGCPVFLAAIAAHPPSPCVQCHLNPRREAND